MTKYVNNIQHVRVIVIGLLIAGIVYTYFTGEGYYTILFLKIDKALFARTLAIISFGLYSRWCFMLPVGPNQQAIEMLFGKQTGGVFHESNLIFVARPFWSIWKSVSIEHSTFTVAAQNRTQDNHSVLVFATGTVVPENVQQLSKMNPEMIMQQVLSLSEMALGQYINNRLWKALFNYQQWDISEMVDDVFKQNHFYGLRVHVRTTKVTEVNPDTMRHFDRLALQTDMKSMMRSLREEFPHISDVELYAVYASLLQVKSSVMSHVIHGQTGNNIFLDGRNNN